MPKLEFTAEDFARVLGVGPLTALVVDAAKARLAEMLAEHHDVLRQLLAYAESDAVTGRMDTTWAIYKQAKALVNVERIDGKD